MKAIPLLGSIALVCTVGMAGCGKTEKTASAPMPEASTKVGQALDDTAITTKVKTELLAEKGVNGTQISVDTKNGQVTLSGTVPPTQIALAEQVARKVDGVREVVNQLKAETAS
jgi:hyperosmotically inducible periplasmic protein